MLNSTSTFTRSSTIFLFTTLILLTGCTRIARLFESFNARGYDRDIRRATQSIAASQNNAQRSSAYADRADAYSEKARYSRLMKLISDDQYNQLFNSALDDYNQALALSPDSAALYYRRGNAYYSRASLDMIYKPTSPSLAPAKADFTRAVQMDPKNRMALDMLGLTDGSMGDWTAALADFEKETALDPKFNFRVSDAYCNRGSRYPKDKSDLAISDLNHAIEMRTNSDPCECEPYNPLLAIYLYQTHQYNKARDLVALAQRSHKWIDPQFLAQLNSSPH